MNNSKQLTIFCATQSIRASTLLSAAFHITNERIIGLVVVRRRCFVGDSRLLLEPLYI